MAKKENDAEDQGRILTSTIVKVGKNSFTFLNSEKLGRVLNWMDEKELPTPENQSDYAAWMSAKQMKDPSAAILALYDRLGGAIRLGDRILKIGTFWDVKTKTPVEKVDLTEDDFGDEMVLVPKRSRKVADTESPEDRIKRLRAKRDLAREEAVE